MGIFGMSWKDAEIIRLRKANEAFKDIIFELRAENVKLQIENIQLKYDNKTSDAGFANHLKTSDDELEKEKNERNF